VNELTPRNSASYVGGFFFDRDLFPKQDAERMQGCAGSNVAEMFYMLVPDPQGTVNGNVRTKSFVASKTVGTIAHELQHLVNSARRLYVNGASDFEDTWLNEGLAHVAEELMFYRLSGLGPRQGIDLAKVRSSSTVLNAFNEYSLANFGRYREFLRAPERNAAFAANDELSTRGATWAFLRYAADRLAGDDAQLWYRLVNAKTSGMTNLRAVLGAEPLEWLADWAVSEAASAAAGGVEARYQQSSWSYRSIFPAVATGGHPLLTRTLGDGVPTTVTLGGGGAAFLRVGVQGGTGAMRLRTPAGATLPATLKLSVVRTK
jgi:hypothetical protein